MSPRGYAVTIIPEAGRSTPDDLTNMNLSKFIADFSRHFRNSAPKAYLLGCVDISLNDHRKIGGDVHCQFHVHSTVVGLKKGDREQLRETFKWQSDGCARPVVIKSLTDVAGQLAYMSKSNFVRRVSYYKNGRKTRIETMSLAEEAELSAWLANYPADKRVIRIGDILTECTRLKAMQKND